MWSGYRACFLGTLTYKFGCPKGSLEFFLEHSLDLCSCSLFYTNNYIFCSCYQAWLLGTLAYKFGCPKGSLEFILEHSLNLCSCSLFYANRGTPNAYLWTLNLRLKEGWRKNWRQNPGLVLRKLWHMETTPFNKLMTNLRKWKKLIHVPRTNVHSETQKLRRQNANVLRSRACIAFFPTWSLNFQIADTCTHCVPIFISAPKEKRLNFLGCLVREHGGRRAYTLRENEKHKARSKTFQVLHNPFNQGDSSHNPGQVRFWGKAYYGRKRT